MRAAKWLRLGLLPYAVVGIAMFLSATGVTP